MLPRKKNEADPGQHIHFLQVAGTAALGATSLLILLAVYYLLL